eukprot:GHVU01209698.1.p2 GENE.GHVU01209698.1~~GHVU01209698.1.p2  ORF type:complete len:112 (+),score=6.37 GHVU01209698.1:1354-1689(+)
MAVVDYDKGGNTEYVPITSPLLDSLGPLISIRNFPVRRVLFVSITVTRTAQCCRCCCCECRCNDGLEKGVCGYCPSSTLPLLGKDIASVRRGDWVRLADAAPTFHSILRSV